MIILIFILLNLISCTNSDISSNINFFNDTHVRLRRSNFPCGKSFIRCATSELFAVNVNDFNFVNTVSSSSKFFAAGIKNVDFENGKMNLSNLFKTKVYYSNIYLKYYIILYK